MTERVPVKSVASANCSQCGQLMVFAHDYTPPNGMCSSCLLEDLKSCYSCSHTQVCCVKKDILSAFVSKRIETTSDALQSIFKTVAKSCQIYKQKTES